MRNYKAQYRSPRRVKIKKSVFRGRFFWPGISALFLSGVLFYLIVFFPPFQIKEIKITGNAAVLEESILEKIEDKINMKIINFFSRSIFLVNLREIEKNILSDSPKLAGVRVERNFPGIISAVVEERVGLAGWRGAGVEPENSNNQNNKYFLIDKEGVIFEEADLAETPVKITNRESPSDFSLGAKVIEGELLSHILKIESNLKEKFKISVSEFLIVSRDRLNVKINEGWEAYFNPGEDMDWQLTKLVLVLEKEIPPDFRRNLEYIELRFGERAYFKYKN